MLNFGERLKNERLRLGYNQADLATLAGVAKTSQFNYEKGERYPDAAYLIAVANAGVDVVYLLTGSPAPTASDALTAQESLNLKRYRTLNEGDQAAIDRLLDAMSRTLLAP